VSVLAALSVLAVWVPTQYVVPVLMYHSDTDYSQEPLNNVRPENFVRQMDFLKKFGYKVIPIEDLAEGIRSGKKFPFGTVAIRFDDGYQDNYTSAYPVLKERGFPATIFIVVDKMGTPGRLTWPQIQEMAANRITVASHTLSHTYLPDDNHEKLVEEILGSKRAIEQRIGRNVDFLSYPVGGFSPEAKEVARQAGYRAAFTTNRGKDRLNKDLFELKRIRIKDSDVWYVFFTKLSGYYNFFRSRKM
jgi:peptidoglycan/xylan/chitin deacetylase (PgdA/CDA1 family)